MGILDKVKKTAKNSEPKTEKKAVKKTKKVNADKVVDKSAKVVSKVTLNTILGPVISEKSAQLSEADVVIFRVAKDANRVQVKNAVKALYGVIPERVNVINVRGKAVSFGRRRGKRSDYKKALVKLPKGTSLNIFEGV